MRPRPPGSGVGQAPDRTLTPNLCREVVRPSANLRFRRLVQLRQPHDLPVDDGSCRRTLRGGHLFPRDALHLFSLVLVDGAGQFENQLGRPVGDMAGTCSALSMSCRNISVSVGTVKLARGDRGEAGSDGQLVQFGVSFLLSLFLATRLTAAKAIGR